MTAREDDLLGEAVLARGLEAVERLLSRHLARAVKVFGARALAFVDLPPLGPDRTDRDQIGAVAALLWCREMEGAGVLSLVEAIARRLSEGEPWDLAPATLDALMHLQRPATQRFREDERRALYRQVFDGAFDASFDRLCRTLAELGRAPHDRFSSDLRAAIDVLVDELASVLSSRGAGIVPFAARDIRADVVEAVHLLRSADLVRALGGGTPALIIARLAPSLLKRTVSTARGFARAEAGAFLLEWLASASAHRSRRVVRGPVTDAAERWLAWGADR